MALPFLNSLKHRIQIAFIALFIFVIVISELIYHFGIPFTGKEGSIKQFEREEVKEISYVADLKKNILIDWLRLHKQNANVVSESDWLKSKLTAISSTEITAKNWQSNEGIESINQHLDTFIESFGFYRRLVIYDNQTNKVVSSTQRDAIGKNISDLWGHETFSYNQRHNYELVLFKDLKAGLGLFTKISVNYSEGKARYSLLSHILAAGTLEKVQQVGNSLGKTGEVVLVEFTGVILTELNHPLADGTKAQPYETALDDVATKLATWGREGTVKTKDYRGKDVIAAFRHLYIDSDVI